MPELSPIERWVYQALRIPPAPQTPQGSPNSIQVFHAGRAYYTWCLLVWLASHLGILVVLIVCHELAGKGLPRLPEWARIIWRIAESLAALAFIGSLIFTFFSQRLNFILRWYMITDRSLRIRTGAIRMRELTMTFSNIQEIRVSAGPIQNLLKLADVEVHSAGGGSGAKGGGGHIGRFEGVSNANAIRDLIVERLRQYRDSGLGESSPPAPDQTFDAARVVLTEVRALRELLTLSGR